MAENLHQLQARISNTPEGLKLCLEIAGRFRMLLDPDSSEWKSTTLAEKRAIVERFDQLGISLDELCNAMKLTYEKRPDIVSVVDVARTAILKNSEFKAWKEAGKGKQ